MKTELSRLIQGKTALTEEELAFILKCFKWVKVNKHEHLLEQGEVADQLFFIQKGCLRLYYNTEEFGIVTGFMAFEYTFLTSLVSFIAREPSTEFIEELSIRLKSA